MRRCWRTAPRPSTRWPSRWRRLPIRHRPSSASDPSSHPMSARSVSGRHHQRAGLRRWSTRRHRHQPRRRPLRRLASSRARRTTRAASANWPTTVCSVRATLKSSPAVSTKRTPDRRTSPSRRTTITTTTTRTTTTSRCTTPGRWDPTRSGRTTKTTSSTRRWRP